MTRPVTRSSTRRQTVAARAAATPPAQARTRDALNVLAAASFEAPPVTPPSPVAAPASPALSNSAAAPPATSDSAPAAPSKTTSAARAVPTRRPAGAPPSARSLSNALSRRKMTLLGKAEELAARFGCRVMLTVVTPHGNTTVFRSHHFASEGMGGDCEAESGGSADCAFVDHTQRTTRAAVDAWGARAARRYQRRTAAQAPGAVPLRMHTGTAGRPGGRGVRASIPVKTAVRAVYGIRTATPADSVALCARCDDPAAPSPLPETGPGDQITRAPRAAANKARIRASQQQQQHTQ